MYQIRKVETTDLATIITLVEDCKRTMKISGVTQWTDTYPQKNDIQKDIQVGHSYVILKARKIAGFITYDQIPPVGLTYLAHENHYFIKRLMVHSSAKGLGLGKILIDYCQRHLTRQDSEIYSLTNHTNSPMKRLFSNANFKQVKTLKFRNRAEMGDFYLYKKKVSGEKEMNKIVVLGSLNMDLVITADRLPKIGETMLGKDMNYMSGGKGANQAVAAARLGSPVTMLGKVGTDTFGEKLLKHLVQDDINIEPIISEVNVFTGIASIYKLPTDNCITVISGANELVDPEYVKKSLHGLNLKSGDVFITQLEIPLKSALAGLKIAKAVGAKTILNPAPYQDGLEELLPYVDIITPNETEFADLIGEPSELSEKQLFEKMSEFSQKYGAEVIVTRGSRGVSYTNHQKVVTIPAIKVAVVDTTGAGDTFNGALGSALAKEIPYAEAVQQASIAASLAVTKLGAQSAMPTLEELERHL